MKPTLHPKVIFRTPRFSLADSIGDCWQELKEAIAESSVEFHGIIKDVDAGAIPTLPENVQHTIWKYFNRSKHRSTPFGTFAAVGMCELLRKSTGTDPLVIGKTFVEHRFSDWQLKGRLEYDFKDLKERDGKLFANSTHYRIGRKLRFVALEQGKFQIAEMEPDALVLETLKLCCHPMPLNDVASHLAATVGGTREEIEDGIMGLISVQLLLTSLDPNIVGEDYFSRRGFKAASTDRHYTISERECHAGGFPPALLRHLNAWVDAMRRYMPQGDNAALMEFAARFRSRFDRREVPIMAALDPEIGIGYGGMASSPLEDGLIQQLASNRATHAAADSNPVREHVSKVFMEDGQWVGRAIRLDGLDNRIDAADLRSLPNTLACLLTEADGAVFIEHMGGASAVALAGRFTLGSDKIHGFAKEMATLERDANPDVEFFDMAYMAEPAIDNVSRRKHIYGSQLTILGYDTSDNPITLDDIMVSVEGGQVVLRSRRLNRRLIPRLATAYNYRRSDLPVFRFLCDLQYQGIHTVFQFRMEQWYPGLPHYPRVQYRNIIVSPEKWLLRKADMEKGESLASYLAGKSVPRHIRYGFMDQTLYFDCWNGQDMAALGRYLMRSDELLVEEAFVPEDSRARDSDGKPYASQFMVTLTHPGTVYRGTGNSGLPPPNVAADRYFPPGSEWLYWEIHCPTTCMDELLVSRIAPFLERFGTAISKWFFIRYNEGGDHIRLRLRLRHLRHTQRLVTGLSERLSGPLETGQVSDVRIRAYDRELERYGPDLIESVEEYFHMDSETVLSILKDGWTDEEKYAACIALADNVWKSGIPGLDGAHHASKTVLASLQREHRMGAAHFAALNKRYGKLVEEGWLRPKARPTEDLHAPIVGLLWDCQRERRNSLFTDVFHMHVNRLFPSHQRTHEMAIYYFLDKMAKAEFHGKRHGLQAPPSMPS